jgi:hypothetical protein
VSDSLWNASFSIWFLFCSVFSKNYFDEDYSCFNPMVLTICTVLAIGFSFNFSVAVGVADLAALQDRWIYPRTRF